MNLRKVLPCALLFALASSVACAQDHWVSTWGAASLEQPIAYLQNIPPSGLTYRNIIHTTVGGTQVRVTVSNVYGGGPLTFNDTTVAVAAASGNGAVVASTINGMTFGGLHVVTIPAGQIMVSDPVTMTVPQNSDFAVSFHVTVAPTKTYTDHDNGKGLNYFIAGDHTNDVTIPSATALSPWHFISAVDAYAPADAAAIVIIGDSTTDGAGDGDANGSNNRWPNYFYNQLVANGHPDLAVVNEGMGSDRLFTDGGLLAVQYPDSPNAKNDEDLRPSGLHRFQRDVLDRAGVKYVIILEGVNDEDAITRGVTCTAADLENAYQTLQTQAHTQDSTIKVFVATVTPLGSKQAAGSNPLNLHNTVNTWIRNNSSLFANVMDFDSALGNNVTTTDKYKTGDGSSDNLHPSNAGRHIEASTASAISPFN